MDCAHTGHRLPYHSSHSGVSPIHLWRRLLPSIFQLGASCLTGFALFLVLVPVQERIMSFQHKQREKANVWTDGRANLILEVLGGMRIVKYFSYELPFLKRV